MGHWTLERHAFSIGQESSNSRPLYTLGSTHIECSCTACALRSKGQGVRVSGPMTGSSIGHAVEGLKLAAIGLADVANAIQLRLQELLCRCSRLISAGYICSHTLVQVLTCSHLALGLLMAAPATARSGSGAAASKPYIRCGPDSALAHKAVMNLFWRFLSVLAGCRP